MDITYLRKEEDFMYHNTNPFHSISRFLLIFMVGLTIVSVILIRPAREILEHVQTLETMLFPQEEEESVQESVLRFHVRANSDSSQDQAVKMKVKEEVLKQMRTYAGNAASKEETRRILSDHLPEVVQTAQRVLQNEGFSYGVSAYFTIEEFPVKEYGDMTFPAGMYDALRIDLGQAQGHNWWCMLYPSLCFVDAATGVVPESSKEELKHLVSAQDYRELLQEENTVEMHCGLWEKIQQWLE